MSFDIFGLGNSLIDLLIEVTDVELAEIAMKFHLKKGEVRFFDEDVTREILEEIDTMNKELVTSPGGSCANTMHGIAILGTKAVFCGKVGKDKYGDIYEEKMVMPELVPKLARSDKMTGLAITFITPDGQRTFADHLGAAIKLDIKDVPVKQVENSKIVHTTGYLLEDENLRAVALHAMKIARRIGAKISLDLADPGLIERNIGLITDIIKENVNIVFANEDEAKALTGLPVAEALDEISKTVEITIIKVGKDGSYIKHGKDVLRIPGYPAKAIDTTGAGDMYAAGVLHGICHDLDLKISGHLGSYYAAKVVQQVSARLDNIHHQEMDELIQKLS
ncbi:MAG: adenosine kinase [Candidatus Hodarchaeales archaeon]|jgi:sugar/nucleoside kinase (ribokinase family)